MSDEVGRLAVRKKRAGEDLTRAEETAFKEYMRQYTKRSALIYVPTPEDLAHYKGLSDEQGYSTFSKFVVAMLKTATTGNMVEPEYLDLVVETTPWRETWRLASDVEMRSQCQTAHAAMFVRVDSQARPGVEA